MLNIVFCCSTTRFRSPFVTMHQPYPRTTSTASKKMPGSVSGQLGAPAELPPFHLVDVRAGATVRGDKPFPGAPRFPAVVNVHAWQVLPDCDLAGKRFPEFLPCVQFIARTSQFYLPVIAVHKTYPFASATFGWIAVDALAGLARPHPSYNFEQQSSVLWEGSQQCLFVETSSRS